MNDCCRDAAYFFSEENKDKLQVLMRTAQRHCTERSDVFINHAKFYPRLRPEYAELVPLYTQAAREAGAFVHDGKDYLERVKLRDHMHFAVESTTDVVDMYFHAVQQMRGPGTAQELPPLEESADELQSEGSADPPERSDEEIERAPELPGRCEGGQRKAPAGVQPRQ